MIGWVRCRYSINFFRRDSGFNIYLYLYCEFLVVFLEVFIYFLCIFLGESIESILGKYYWEGCYIEV